MRVPCVRTPVSAGEPTRRALAEAGVLDRSGRIDREDDWLYIPVTDPDGVPDGFEVVTWEVEPRETQTTPEDLLEFAPTYERLGELVLLDEPDPDRAREAAAAIMDSDLPVTTVVNKASSIMGETRVRDWELLAGDRTETVYREYGCEYALDIREVYFSPRLATERHRVVEQVRADEHVFDMFAGVGPYVIPMAKRDAVCVAVDVNPAAVRYLRENLERNDVPERVTAVCGDVREVAGEYEGWADRIVMNLPQSADQFIETALQLAGPECVLHYYDIQPSSNPFGPGERAITDAAQPAWQVEVLTRRIVRSYSPSEVNVCLDIRLHQP